MLWRLRVPLWRRIAVSLLLCGGLFVISAAIIRCALTLTARPSVLNVNLWGYRETVVALGAVTAPVLSPLFRSSFWRGRGGFVADGGLQEHEQDQEQDPQLRRRQRGKMSWRRFGIGTSLMKSSFWSVKSSSINNGKTEATTQYREEQVDVEEGLSGQQQQKKQQGGDDGGEIDHENAWEKMVVLPMPTPTPPDAALVVDRMRKE